MIEMAVAEHDRLDRGAVESQAFEVVGQSVRRDPRVEQQGMGSIVPASRHQHGEPVLGHQARQRFTLLEWGADTRGVRPIAARRAGPMSVSSPS